MMIQRLWRTIGGGGIAPAQVLAIDQDNSTRNPLVAATRQPMRPWKAQIETLHPRVGQSEKIRMRHSVGCQKWLKL